MTGESINVLNWIWQLTVAVFVVYLIKYHWCRRQLYKLSWKIPGPAVLPIIGNGLCFLCKNEDLLDRIMTIINGYTSPMRLWLGPKVVIVFSDEDQVQKILTSSIFSYKDDLYRFIEPFEGQSLISGSGPKWKNDRKVISPLFSVKHVENYMHIIKSEAGILVEMLSKKADGTEFNVEKYIHRCSSEIVIEILTGIKSHAQYGHIDAIIKIIDRMYEIIHSRIAKVWLQPDFIFNLTKFSKEQENGITIVNDFLLKKMRTVESNFKIGDAPLTSVLEHLTKVRRENPNFATDLEMCHHLMTLYTAAEDTINSITSFALTVFGMYPHVQEKIYEEIINVAGPNAEDITFQKLGKLVYLNMCIKELLRLFPIGPFIVRKASTEIEIDGQFIPKGCSIVVAIHKLHRNPKHWQRPDDFYPEHFLPEVSSKRHSYAYVPFSAGPRGCLGIVLANVGLKTIICSIIQNYKIEAEGSVPTMKLKSDLSVRIKGGHNIKLKKREI